MAGDPFLSGRRVSWWAAVATGLAALATAVWLRDGLPGTAGLEGRVEYVAENGGGFVLGALLRMLAAALVLAFLVALSRALTPGHPILRTVAVQVVTIGVAAELLALSLIAVVLPPLARRCAGGEGELRPVIETLEGAAVAFSGVLGTGLICVGGALLCHAAARTPPFPRALAFGSLLVWGAGLAAAGATLAGSAKGLDLQALLFLPLLTLWAGAVAATHFRPPAVRRSAPR